MISKSELKRYIATNPTAVIDLVIEFKIALDRIQQLVEEQAEDESLWCDPETAPEANLQKALRKLHAVIEGDELTASIIKGREDHGT